MRTILKTVHTYEELSEEAKTRARDDYRIADSDDDWYSEAVVEDLLYVCDKLGIEISTRNESKDIRWSGFWSQGDGASFFGTYKPTADAEAAIKEYAPKDEKLADIAKELDKVHNELAGKEYSCKITKQDYRYCHSNTMAVELIVKDDDDDDDDATYEAIKPFEDRIQQSLRRLADWFYRQLEENYEYYRADKYVIEQLQESDREFYEDGSGFN